MPSGTTKNEVAINNPSEYVYVCSLHPPNISLSLKIHIDTSSLKF